MRITNKRTGHVFYTRAHDHSSMAVASGDLVSTHFDAPATQERGASELVVVANGIPSAPVAVKVQWARNSVGAVDARRSLRGGVCWKERGHLAVVSH